MRRRDIIEIKHRAKMWAIYNLTNKEMVLVRKDVLETGKPKCEKNQVAVPIVKGHVVYTMAYDEFVKNATKSEFKEENNNEN